MNLKEYTKNKNKIKQIKLAKEFNLFSKPCKFVPKEPISIWV